MWAVILKRPENEWAERLERIHARFAHWSIALARYNLPAGRRGNFQCVATGYSQGQGHLIPQNVEEKRALVKEMIDEFMSDADIRAYLNYADGKVLLEATAEVSVR